MSEFDKVHDSFDEPWVGLPDEEAAWNWEEESRDRNGLTKHPPNSKGKWYRWYFIYRTPSGERIRISADEDPVTGGWVNPHRSSGQ